VANVEVVITGKDEFSGVMGGILDSLGNFGSIITGIQSAFELVGSALDAVIEPVINFGKESILAAARVDELRVVNQILGETAGIPALYLEKIATSIRSMGIEAGIAETTIAAFITAELDLGKATDIARIAQDAAVISGQNSSETLKDIVYGIETLNPLVLRHAGIVVDLQLAYKEWAKENGRTVESLTTAEKQQIALNEVLEAGVGIAGAYAAAMEEPGKVLRSFPRYFDDIMVAIGAPFQDAFGTVVFAFADLAKAVTKAVSDGGALKPLLDNIAAAAGFVAEVLAYAAESLTALLSGDTVKLYDLGTAFQNLAGTDSVFYELGTAIRIFQQALDDGVAPLDAFKEALERIATGDGPLAGIAGFLTDIATALQTGDWSTVWETIGTALKDGWNVISPVIDELFARLFNAMENNVRLWTAGGGPDRLANGIMDALNETIESPQFQSKTNTAAQGLVDALKEAFNSVDWGPVWESSDKVMTTVISTIFTTVMDLLVDIFVGIVDFVVGTDSWKQIGQAFRDGFKGAFESDWSLDLEAWCQEHIVDPIRKFFGIASPSTVFAQIGRDLIYGLIAGIGSVATFAMNAIKGIVATILEPFKWILDALGIDTSSLFGGSGGVGDHDPGRTTPGTPSTGASGTTVNQYFAGATINVGSWDEIIYDCVYPNPFIGSTSGQLTGGGGGTGAPR
jgi:hypothetical protein